MPYFGSKAPIVLYSYWFSKKKGKCDGNDC
jgi:hypothetical protein